MVGFFKQSLPQRHNIEDKGFEIYSIFSQGKAATRDAGNKYGEAFHNVTWRDCPSRKGRNKERPSLSGQDLEVRCNAISFKIPTG